MSYASAVNQRYSDIYKKLGTFSYAPYGWELFSRQELGDDVWGIYKILIELPIKIALTPILLPATVATFLLASMASICTACLHAVTLIGALLFDACDVDAESAPSPSCY